jgi:uncharacterized protein (TIGR03663 family)
MATQELRANYPYETRLLSRPLSLSAIRWEFVFYFVLIAVNLITHLWSLGYMAMHHDESIHAWTSWKFFTGTPDTFACGIEGSSGSSPTYCYDPVYHGPSLYLLSYISYFLFGISDATARLPMALAGVGMVASCWMLRPLMGRRASLIAAAYFTISPTLLYFTRFARHDALMLLWSMWMFIGIFRYLQERRGRWLYLAAAGIALGWATHELIFILLFIMVTFIVLRVLFERLSRKVFLQGLLVVGGLLLLPMLLLDGGSKLGGIAMLIFVTMLMVALSERVWGREPIMTRGLNLLITEDRGILLKALGVFLVIFTICFTVVFTHPAGFVDGFYAGLAYWFGSQHEFRRGNQPWFYYIMMLPVYEPAVLLLAFGGIGWRIWEAFAPQRAVAEAETPAPTVAIAEAQPEGAARPAVSSRKRRRGAAAASELETAVATLPVLDSETGTVTARPASVAVLNDAEAADHASLLFGNFLFFWFIVALFAFSWAGEKMPWLVVHMTLPAALAGAAVLDRMIARINWAAVREHRGWLTAGLWLLLMLSVGLLLVQLPEAFQDGPAYWLRKGTGIILFMFTVYQLYLLGEKIRFPTVARLIAFTILAMWGLYTVRSMVIGVYRQPDVPRELLVYTQTSPDVPIVVKQIEEIAANLTRSVRDADDPDGGNSMPILLSSGEPNGGDGSLAWPMEWYLRDYPKKAYQDNEVIRNATAETFANGDGVKYPVVMLHKPAVSETTKQALTNAGYVLVSDSVFNWWFPESGAGYKDRLYDKDVGCKTQAEIDASAPQHGGSGQGEYDCPLNGAWGILTWPLRSVTPEDGSPSYSNLKTIENYLIWRDLPQGANIYGREMQVYMLCTVAPLPNNGCGASGGGGGGTLKLVAEELLGQGELNGPRGIALAPDGTIYVAQGATNEVKVLQPGPRPPAGTVPLTGLQGVNFNEPSGVAVDKDGNIYVANTWSGTIEKFDKSGKYLLSWGQPEEDLNPGQRITRTDAKPLGFFGPRGVAVDSRGNVFITDTGNKRVVVTDANGAFLFQWGTGGSGPGQFNEPVGIAIGPDGLISVGDTWNSRVQVFQPDAEGRVSPDGPPLYTIPIQGWTANTYNNPFIAAGPDGLIAVAVPERQQVALYNAASGRQVFTWGGVGADDASLNMPSGLIFDAEGRVYVSEAANHRISVFDPPKVR